jgi:hypothetical protein
MRRPIPKLQTTGIGLQRSVPSPDGLVVNRAERVEIKGLAFSLQRTWILLNPEGTDATPCRIIQSSDDGFRVILQKPELLASLCSVGGRFYLQLTDRTREEVELRWIKYHEAGLRRIRRVKR